MHALEMAKVAWNAVCLGPEPGIGDLTVEAYEREMLHRARTYCELAAHVLRSLGEEGDEGGPLAELHALELLINEV
jgi:hypothetical protein